MAQDEEGRTPLLLAAGRGNLGAVAVLLRLGADPALAGTPFRYAPLHVAVLGRFTATARALLAGGAAVDARTAKRETALHLAAREGFAGMVAALLTAGADWEARASNGWRASAFAQGGRHHKLHVYLEKVRRGKVSVARMQRAHAGLKARRADRDRRRRLKRAEAA